MAVLDLTINQGSEPPFLGNQVVSFVKRIDFSIAANNMVNLDTMKIFDLLAGFHIFLVEVETLTAQGAAATIDIGVTGGTADGYINGADINTVGVVSAGDAGTAESVAMETSGLRLAAAETVSILANNTLDAAVIIVRIFALDCRHTPTS